MARSGGWRNGCALLVVLLLGLAPAGARAAAGTAYVDGISDQNLPSWDGDFSGSYFAGFFHNAWAAGSPGHVTLARYVVQWNVMSGAYPRYRSAFQRWLVDVRSLGLVPDVALSSYDGVRPSSSAEYQASLEAVLILAERMGYPIRYLEAWNEPNNQGGYPDVSEAVTPAHFTNSASAACASDGGCTVIAGNFEDTPQVAAYAREYELHLNPIPTIWGIHPYAAVKTHDDANALAFRAALPAGAQVWITEIGVYRCERYDSEPRGEIRQAEDARWLVGTLMPALDAVHAFYYSYLSDVRQQHCQGGASDTGLYAPGSDPNAPDAPRAAAAFIYDGHGFPWGYTGAVSPAATASATLTGSVYPGGLLDAGYSFEYGPTSGYGFCSPEADAGSGLGGVHVSATVAGLTPGAVYHYRVVVHNREGSSAGADRSFQTEPAPTLASGSAAGLHEESGACAGALCLEWDVGWANGPLGCASGVLGAVSGS